MSSGIMRYDRERTGGGNLRSRPPCSFSISTAAGASAPLMAVQRVPYLSFLSCHGGKRAARGPLRPLPAWRCSAAYSRKHHPALHSPAPGKRDNRRWRGRLYFHAMNIRQAMYKIQTALNLSGRRIKINQFQSWSEQQKRMVTKYMITENSATIIESYHAAEVVQTLAELLQGGD